MIPLQPKLHVGFRIVAAGCIVFWLLASSYCSIENLFGGNHHHAKAGPNKIVAPHDSDDSPEAATAEHSHGEASDTHDSEQASHDSHPHGGCDDTCCSSLIATAPIAAPLVIDKPLVRTLHSLSPVLPARISILKAPQDRWDRQANRRDWAFTPQVYLCPAHRSLAPPSLA